AHCWCIALGDMRLRAFFANLLPDVPLLQRRDQLPPEQQRDEHCRYRRISRAESNVLENVQRLYEIPILLLETGVDQFVKDVIEHSLERRHPGRRCAGVLPGCLPTVALLSRDRTSLF